MLILPERNQPRGKVLMPMLRSEWQISSQRRAIFGEENKIWWRLTARTHDGIIVWRGRFFDREDVDAFLYALACNTLNNQRSLWKLPVPMWPGLDPGLLYAVDTQVALTSPTGSNQTYTSPSDWDSSSNSIELLGAGGGGNATSTGGNRASGGGAGFSGIVDFTFASPGITTATYQIGTGGAGVAATNNTGNTGGDTWFNGTVITSCSVGAKGGVRATSGSGGNGGASASGTGTTKFSGGNGYGGGSGGGGGAAGPAGAGGNGTSADGGSANGGTTAGAPGDGIPGTEWTSYGCGTGGRANISFAGNGGAYGGGGGGIGSGTSGSGANGLIILTYTPLPGKHRMFSVF